MWCWRVSRLGNRGSSSSWRTAGRTRMACPSWSSGRARNLRAAGTRTESRPSRSRGTAGPMTLTTFQWTRPGTCYGRWEGAPFLRSSTVPSRSTLPQDRFPFASPLTTGTRTIRLFPRPTTDPSLSRDSPTWKNWSWRASYAPPSLWRSGSFFTFAGVCARHSRPVISTTRTTPSIIIFCNFYAIKLRVPSQERRTIVLFKKHGGE
mmetsp:Transcript_510/g.1342  ORF Transcript_510/g.1342 Transcript_510/m.1342 type:complete len:206 (-) Transcript_510:46-663(-)